MKRISPIVVPLIIALFIISSVVPRAAHAAPFPPPFNSIDTFLTAQVNALSSVFSTIGCAIYKATGNDICANDDDNNNDNDDTNEPPAGGGLTSKSPEGGERSDLEEQAEEANSANEANATNEANNTRVVERIVERVTETQPVVIQRTGVSQSDLDQMENELRQMIAGVQGSNSSNTFDTVTRTIAHTNKIDNLDSVTITNATIESGISGLTDSDIPDDITASNYLPLTGGTLTGAATATDFTINGTLTASGTTTLNGVSYMFPSADGSSGQVLSTDGAGTLTWTTVSSGGTSNWSFFNNSGIRLATTSNQVLVGASATSSTAAFEVSGQSYFSGNVGIGTTSPYAKLSVVGETVSEFFTATSTTATSTFAGGVNLATGAGLVGIGTTSPARKLDVVNADSNAQLRLSQSTVNFGEFKIDTNGDLQVSASGGDIRALSENLWICDNDGCPSLTSTSTAGNVFVENEVVFGNNFSIAEISETELGIFNATGTTLIIFD